MLVIRSIPVSYKSLLNVEFPQPIMRTSSRGLMYLQRTLAKSTKSEYLKQRRRKTINAYSMSTWIIMQYLTIQMLQSQLYQRNYPNSLCHEIVQLLLEANSSSIENTENKIVASVTVTVTLRSISDRFFLRR